MRVETSDGVVWFKANSAAHRQEAAATALLARVRPEALPELLAYDPESGWMLTRDAGVRLRELVEEERSLAAGSTSSRSTRVSSGRPCPSSTSCSRRACPDRRLAVLPDRFEEILGAVDGGEAAGTSSRASGRTASASPRTACRRRSSTTISTTRRSSSATAASSHRLGRRRRLHPFFSMSVTLQGVIAYGVDDVEGRRTRAVRGGVPRALGRRPRGGAGARAPTRLGVPVRGRVRPRPGAGPVRAPGLPRRARGAAGDAGAGPRPRSLIVPTAVPNERNLTSGGRCVE